MGQFGEWMGRHTAAHANLDIVFGHESLTGFSSTAGVDIRVRVSGGGHTSQVYAIRQAIAKSIVRYNSLRKDNTHHDPIAEYKKEGLGECNTYTWTFPM